MVFDNSTATRGISSHTVVDNVASAYRVGSASRGGPNLSGRRRGAPGGPVGACEGPEVRMRWRVANNARDDVPRNESGRHYVAYPPVAGDARTWPRPRGFRCSSPGAELVKCAQACRLADAVAKLAANLQDARELLARSVIAALHELRLFLSRKHHARWIAGSAPDGALPAIYSRRLTSGSRAHRSSAGGVAVGDLRLTVAPRLTCDLTHAGRGHAHHGHRRSG